MAYIKNTWNTGDTITADLMNHIENGIYDNSTDLDNKENINNKVTGITSESTDAQYPSAKAVYDAIEGAGGSEFTTYHVTVNAVKGQETGYIISGTIQTDLTGVTDWSSFESVCRELAEGSNRLYFRVNITGEDGGYVEHPTYQFMGLINSPGDGAVTIAVYGDDCYFKMGDDDGIYRHIILRYSTEQYEIGMNDFTFVS